MNIIIVGMGEVGQHISRVLAGEQHDVVIIDLDQNALRHAEDTIDAMVLRGHGASPATLESANVAAADLFIAVTDNSEANMLAAIRAKQFGADKTIARVSDPAYFRHNRGLVTDMLSIDIVINPDTLVAVELHKLVRSVNAVAVEDFSDNRIEMIQLPIDEVTSAVNRPLKDVRLPESTLIAAILRDERLIVPSGEDVIYPGDQVFGVGRIDQISEFESMFNRQRKRFTRKVIIAGGTETAAKFASALADDGIDTILIETNFERCRELSEQLPNVVILHGDPTDPHLLEEENVSEADVFVALGDTDENNLMSSVLAKDLGVERTIAVIHRPAYRDLCDRLGLDTFLSPRLEVAEQVLKHVRTGEVVSATPVEEGKGEFLEFIAPESARVVGQPLRDLDLPDGANVCALVDSQGNASVPRGDAVIDPGDRVIVFTLPDHRSTIEDAFRG